MTEHHITRECGHGKFLPTGEFRTLRENDHYLSIDSDYVSLRNQAEWTGNWECAFTHTSDWPEGPPYVILKMLEECDKGCL